MQNIDRNEENDGNLAESSIAALACPQCGNAKTRRSSTKTSDGTLRILFYKSYRCRGCRYRFWVVNPLRMVLFGGIILIIAIIVGGMWLSSNEQKTVGGSAEAITNDQIKKLAEKGDAEAELQMGLHHILVNKGVKDDKAAVQWFEKAARHDQIEAQYRYGLALMEGQGVVQDYKTAFYWLEKSARRGHPQAQFSLGEMYRSGMGIVVDMEHAYLWFNLAAAQGINKAVNARDLALQLLKPNQIAAMQEEAKRISRGQHYEPVTDKSITVGQEPDPESVETDTSNIQGSEKASQ